MDKIRLTDKFSPLHFCKEGMRQDLFDIANEVDSLMGIGLNSYGVYIYKDEKENNILTTTQTL